MTADPVSYVSDVHLAMQAMFIAWIGLVWLIIRRTISAGSVGLPAALALTMTFLYGGCFAYAVPGYTHMRPDGNLTLIQYEFSEWMIVMATFASLLGILGFALGCGVFSRGTASKRQDPPASHPASERNIITILGGVGLLGFAIHYLNITFPMSSAINEFGRNVAVAAIVLGAYLARRGGRSMLIWGGLAALIPLYYLVGFGFASYGFIFGIILVGFWMAQLRRRGPVPGFLYALFGPLAVWLILTGFVAWFSFRDEIRLVVWQAESGSVFEIALQALRETELFAPWNFASLDLVNIRLNLNIFVGRMIEHHSMHPELQQHGATLVTLPLVLLPRFLWLGKPTRGGSDFMEEHTGMLLSDSSSFGTGTVFEFYINFGYAGILLGFIVLGLIIRRIDRIAAHHLSAGEFFDFARLFVVGIVAVDPLLRPFFIVNGGVLAWILMTILKQAASRLLGNRAVAGSQDAVSLVRARIALRNLPR